MDSYLNLEDNEKNSVRCNELEIGQKKIVINQSINFDNIGLESNSNQKNLKVLTKNSSDNENKNNSNKKLLIFHLNTGTKSRHAIVLKKDDGYGYLSHCEWKYNKNSKNIWESHVFKKIKGILNFRPTRDPGITQDGNYQNIVIQTPIRINTNFVLYEYNNGLIEEDNIDNFLYKIFPDLNISSKNHLDLSYTKNKNRFWHTSTDRWSTKFLDEDTILVLRAMTSVDLSTFLGSEEYNEQLNFEYIIKINYKNQKKDINNLTIDDLDIWIGFRTYYNNHSWVSRCPISPANMNTYDTDFAYPRNISEENPAILYVYDYE